MKRLFFLPVAFLALLRAGALVRADDQPQLVPARDVDITYDISWPQQPKTQERRRWIADEHLQRVDGPDKSSNYLRCEPG